MQTDVNKSANGAESPNTEMELNDPYFKRLALELLREHFERDLPPLPDKDLDVIAAEEGALPLKAFIGDLEKLEEEP